MALIYLYLLNKWGHCRKVEQAFRHGGPACGTASLFFASKMLATSYRRQPCGIAWHGVTLLSLRRLIENLQNQEVHMKITYDPTYNIAYIRLHRKSRQVETVKVSDQLNVDLSPDGTVYGIEFLNANEPFSGAEKGRVVFENEAQGTRESLTVFSG